MQKQKTASVSRNVSWNLHYVWVLFDRYFTMWTDLPPETGWSEIYTPLEFPAIYNRFSSTGFPWGVCL
jgi:hypothetical protein